jgi:hypothetical protein
LVDTLPGPEVNIFALLAERARHASDGRLAADAAGGLLLATAMLLWRPGGWPMFASAALCVLAYGGWGIADRTLQETDPAHATVRRLLAAARAAAAVIGTLAAIALVLVVMGLALGNWIS